VYGESPLLAHQGEHIPDHTAIRGVALQAPVEPDSVAERDGATALFPQQNRNYSSMRDSRRELGRSVAMSFGSL
jgi:hypothetical protein